ncbi:MAG: aspartate aminotransferase family protein [Rhodospirillales bacterium]
MSQLYPFTDPLVAQDTPPKAMVSGRGCQVTDAAGQSYLDGVAGLWCASLGFSEERLIRAAEAQYRRLPYYHSFMGRTAAVTEELAAKLASLLPGNLNQVFFGCSGSDAVETAAKLTRFYWNARDRPEKKAIVAREGAYHGSLASSAGLTAMDYCHKGFDLPGPTVLRTGAPYHFKEAEPGESEIAFAKRRARELDELIRAVGADQVGAFIGEPVIGAGGVVPPPEGYWAEIQEVLTRHDVLLIADEVITGFGRTGNWFASQTYDLRPDLLTMAKQLTGAYFPLSAVGISDRVARTIAPYAHDLGTLGHGLTYGGHPVGCAVALEAIALYEEMDLPRHVARLARSLAEGLVEIEALSMVADVRKAGFMAGVELKASLKARDVAAEMERQGLLLRVIDNSLAISPPYIVTDEELAFLFRVLADSIASETTKLEGLAA